MSRSIWLISIMGLLTGLVMAAGMAVTLSQFQEVPAVEWVRLSESIAREFKAENVGVRVVLRDVPSRMVVTYSALIDSKYDLSLQNAEMEKVATYAIQNYKGREQTKVDQIEITRSETHGRGCFRHTYVSRFTLPNPLRRTSDLPGFPGTPFDPRKQ